MQYAKLIGVPYTEKDCWQIAVAFYSMVFGIELAPYYQEIPKERKEAQRLVYDAIKDFYPVSKPEFGDLLLMRMFGLECHIGVYLGNGKVLHTFEKTGCVIDSFAKWEKVLVGCYRPKVRENVKT